MSSLSELAEKYRSDKLLSHSYVPFYQELLSEIHVRNLLEIGIGYPELMEPFAHGWVPGSSLRMWSEFFPEARIFACDIRPDTLINEGNIRSWVCDQSDEMSIHKLIWAIETYGPSAWIHFDVIIDDGSHRTSDQLLTAKILLPHLIVGGAYVIEDAQEPDVLLYELGINVMAKKIKSIDVFKFGKRPDDNLVVMRR